MSRKKRVGAQFTFRCDAEMANQLRQVAEWLHTDVNGVLTRLTLSGLPALLSEARVIQEAYKSAQLVPLAESRQEDEEQWQQSMFK